MRSKKSILRSISASSKIKLTYGYADSLVAAAVISIPIDIDIPIHIDSDMVVISSPTSTLLPSSFLFILKVKM